jgi:hypothetical protein
LAERKADGRDDRTAGKYGIGESCDLRHVDTW